MAEKIRSAAVRTLTPLDRETRTGLPTSEMARHLGRAETTLHQWSHYGTYPACLRPTRIRGRLLWPVAGAKQLLGIGEEVSAEGGAA